MRKNHNPEIWFVEPDGHGMFDVMNAQGVLIAQCESKCDAKRIAKMRLFIEDMLAEFPGLADRETDVNGGDLVEFVSRYVDCFELDK